MGFTETPFSVRFDWQSVKSTSTMANGLFIHHVFMLLQFPHPEFENRENKGIIFKNGQQIYNNDV